MLFLIGIELLSVTISLYISKIFYVQVKEDQPPNTGIPGTMKNDFSFKLTSGIPESEIGMIDRIK